MLTFVWQLLMLTTTVAYAYCSRENKSLACVTTPKAAVVQQERHILSIRLSLTRLQLTVCKLPLYYWLVLAYDSSRHYWASVITGCPISEHGHGLGASHIYTTVQVLSWR